MYYITVYGDDNKVVFEVTATSFEDAIDLRKLVATEYPFHTITLDYDNIGDKLCIPTN